MAATFTTHAAPQSDMLNRFEMSQGQKLQYAEKIIESYYVDTVNTNKIVEDAIVAMLKNLDPHSSYSNAQETKELTEPLDGNISGIGIQFNMLNDTLYVIQTTSGGPSEKVGIMPGDRILVANDSLISGVKSTNKRILGLLRGPKGTPVELKVLRKGVQAPMTFNIIRDDIPIYSVDAAYMADPQTGFIRISRFAESTDEEFEKALNDLRSQGMKNLILDLEDNGGGYLGSAYELASRFLSKGDVVVSTNGPATGETIFDVKRNGDFRDGRVVVTVNSYSASASEITAGAIQDNDRGLVVGRRTFGKGLVQRPFPFPDGSMIRLTVSKYYTPSGRCIQKPYTPGEEEDYALDMLHRYEAGEFTSADSVHFDPSLRYSTIRNKRTVYGGGGIMPDVFVPSDTTYYSAYYRDLLAKGIFNRLAVTYVDENRAQLKSQYPTADDFVDRFNVGQDIIDRMVEMGVRDSVPLNEEQLQRSLPMIKAILKGLIGSDTYDRTLYYKVVYPVLNPIYREALNLINDPERYDKLLKEGSKSK